MANLKLTIMKITKLLFTLFLTAGLATTGFGQISGTPHDLSGDAWNTNSDLCLVCHTPHNANVSYFPLWDREITTSVFTPYPSGGTMQSTPGSPTGTSLLCLGCHDGTVALENYGGVTTGTNYVTGNALLDNDLTNDHPVALTFDAALATSDGELYDPTTQPSGLGGTIAQDMLFGASNDQLECSSCHDVHDNTNGFFLIKPNITGSLCLTCHNK